MLKIKGLEVLFSDHKILDGLELNLKQGGIYGIIGLNGSGKTTFFNTIAGIVKKKSGTLSFNDATLDRNDVGYLETVNYFYPYLTGNEYLNIFKKTNSDFDLGNLQLLFNLPLDDSIETYSTGMKKKLALLAVIKQTKKIYVFDEPFNGLDLESNKVVELIIQKLANKGSIVLISSHILDPLLNCCSEIFMLKNGAIDVSYSKETYGKIESDLFGKFLTDAAAILEKSV